MREIILWYTETECYLEMWCVLCCDKSLKIFSEGLTRMIPERPAERKRNHHQPITLTDTSFWVWKSPGNSSNNVLPSTLPSLEFNF